jgi:prepilin-type N-terminal cleavage/methylation domain-containing protein
MRKRRQRRGFTIVELLVVMAIIALLVAVSFPAYSLAINHAHCSVCASNMHGLGIAFLSYAYDNQGALPQRVVTGNKWPTLLLPYVGNDPSIYIDPGDPVASKIPLTQVVSNDPNNSSFIFNGFNDLGADGNPHVTVSIFNIPAPSSVLLLGQQVPGGDNFYLDVSEGDQNTVLKKEAYFGGSNYIFADGTLRYMKATEYQDSMWLVNQSYVIPGS